MHVFHLAVPDLWGSCIHMLEEYQLLAHATYAWFCCNTVREQAHGSYMHVAFVKA